MGSPAVALTALAVHDASSSPVAAKSFLLTSRLCFALSVSIWIVLLLDPVRYKHNHFLLSGTSIFTCLNWRLSAGLSKNRQLGCGLVLGVEGGEFH